MGSWGESGEVGGGGGGGGGHVGQSIQSCRKPSVPSGGFASLSSGPSMAFLNRRLSAGEMKAKVDKGRVKGIDSGGMQGKCDR